MKKKTLLVKLLFLAALPLLAFKLSWAQAQPKGGAMDSIRSKIALEGQIEERLRLMLTSFLNTKDVAVAVKINLLVKKAEAEQAGGVRKWDEKEEIILPGVPAAADMTRDSSAAKAAEAAKKQVRLGVASVNIWIIVGKQITKEQDAKIKKLVADALDLQVETGDTISIESAPGEKQSMVLNIGAIVALICLVVFSIFLYGPFRAFLKRLPDALTAMAPAKAVEVAAAGKDSEEGGSESTMTGALSLSGGGGGSSVITFDSGENVPLEKYVTKDNVEDLLLILNSETPETVAKVVQRIPQKLAFQAIPKQMMKDVLEQFLTRKCEEPEAIKKMMDGIRDKMAGSFGGEARLGNLMQIMNKKAQERTLAFVRERDAVFATELETHFFRFEDLLRYYDETTMRRIFRKAGAESFARCLKHCDEATVESFFEMLGPAIKDLVTVRMNNMLLIEDSNDAELTILAAVNALAEKGLILPLANVKKAKE